MPPKSLAPSQLASGTATPRHGEDHLDSSYSSPLFSAQLQDRLRQLDARTSNAGVDRSQESPAAAKTHSFNKNALVHSIEVLGEDRRKTSELAREQALGNLLRIFVMRYDPVVMNYELFSTLVQSYVSSRTEIEASTALQLVCVSTTMLDGSEDPRCGDSYELVQGLRAGLLKRTGPASAVGVKQAIATSFAVLTYFLNAGGGGYGMEAAAAALLELAEAVSEPEDAPVVAAAATGAALLITLLTPGAVAELASDWLYTLLPMLDLAHIGARLAAVKLVAVLFEAAPAPALFSADNADASEQIIAALEEMSQESIARTAKRDKKTQNLLVKSVLKTCLAQQERARHADSEDAAQDVVSDLVLHYHKHTLSKSLGITTWAALVVIEHLGWVFGPGLHIQLASNPYIKSLLRKEDVKVDNAVATDSDDSEGWRTADNAPSRATDSAKKSRELRKMQLRKAEDRGILD